MNNGQHFSNIVFLDTPIIEFLNQRTDFVSLDLDYVNPNPKTNEFLFKFRLMLPKGNSGKTVKIKHGYAFYVKEKSVMHPTSNILADFFATLIYNSINESNKKITGGQISFAKSDLLPAVKHGLASEKN